MVPHSSRSTTMPNFTSYRSRSRQQCLTLLLLVVVAGSGCSKEEMQEKLEAAKAKTKSLTDSAVQAVEERLPESGHVALELDASQGSGASGPIELKLANIEVIAIGDGRPNVVQIVTYDPSASSRTFPSLMLHGTTTASSASALSGTTVDCDMYYQSSASDPIAKTAIGQTVAVSFGALNAEDNALPATIGAVGLVGSDDQPVRIRGGELLAVIRGEGN